MNSEVRQWVCLQAGNQMQVCYPMKKTAYKAKQKHESLKETSM